MFGRATITLRIGPHSSFAECLPSGAVNYEGRKWHLINIHTATLWNAAWRITTITRSGRQNKEQSTTQHVLWNIGKKCWLCWSNSISTCSCSDRNITTQLLLILVLQLDRLSEREIVSFTYGKLFTVVVHGVYATQLPAMSPWLAVALCKHYGQPQ